MMVLLAILAGLVLLMSTWRGTRGQAPAVRMGSRGAALVLAGALVVGSLLMVTDPGERLVITEGMIRTLPTGERIVAGSVENHTDRPMSPARLELDFIDAESRIIDRVATETAEIPPRGRWDFEVPVKLDAAVGFRGRVGSPDNVRPVWLGGGCGSDLCRRE